MKKFTLKELAAYNGKNQKPSYIGFQGFVYDVSESFLWKQGKHQVFHEAGMDLTKMINDAPHGPDLLNRVKKIGILKD